MARDVFAVWKNFQDKDSINYFSECENRHFLGKTFTSIANCAKTCEDNKDCLSFSHNDKSDECRLTASCYELNTTRNDNFNTYVKNNAKLDNYPLTKFNMY